MDDINIGDTEVAKDGGRVIRISADVEKRLKARGEFDQTFNDVIRSVLDELDKKEKK